MWTLIIGFVVIVGVIVVVMNRRGSTGASRADDLPSSYTADGQKHTGGFGGWRLPVVTAAWGRLLTAGRCERGPTNLPVTQPQVRALRTVQSMGWP